MSCSKAKHKRASGFYKLNNSLLEDENYIQLISQLILDKTNEMRNVGDKRIVWDFKKLEMQTASIDYSIKKAKERRKLESDILNKCDVLYTKLCDKGLSNDEINIFRI